MTSLDSLTLASATDTCCAGPDGALLPPEAAELLAGIFKAVADPTRVRLLAYLAAAEGGTACACHLPSALGISQPTLSFHLAKLRAAGLVDGEKRGRWMHWTVRPEVLALARDFLGAPSSATSTCC